jgi:tRNA threonylcarbamoyladenosine biosynthesis protein TsaE
MKHKLTAESPGNLPEVAKKLLEVHSDKKVFAFYAAMGAGKTTFIHTLCKLLQVVDTVSSPTFAIINEYLTENGGSIYHFDFYRIKKLAEAVDIASEEYFYSGNFCFIEWPALVEEILPDDAVEVSITVDPESGNRIFEF